ncbi:hypothetical protein PGB90_000543 [Kerria lacca]
MTSKCKKGKGCLEDICGKQYSLDELEISTFEMKEKVEKKPGIELKNPNIAFDKEDILYHLALGNKSHDLTEMFGDVKFVCLGGTPHRMERFAYYILQEIGYKIPPGTALQDISTHSHRYALFKVGPVISVSHGMGIPSINILLHELIKLMFHAGVKDPIFFRLGTCGGLGLEPGTVVITTEALNGTLEPVHTIPILGKKVERPALLDKNLAEEIINLKESSDNFNIISGKTVCTDDFYEGQGRLDGAFCHFSEEDKYKYLNMAKEKGVTNIEMESLALAAITHHVGIKSAVICVTLLDRLKGDQINQTKKTLEEWQDRPMVIAARYIKKYLNEHIEVLAKVENKSKQKKSFPCPDCINIQKYKFDVREEDSESTSSKSSVTYKSSSENSTSSMKSDIGCVPGCSIVVSNVDYLQRVLDESNGFE